MPTAYEDDLDLTATAPLAQKTAVAASVPTRMSPGFDTRGMTNSEVANQVAWSMQPRWYKQYQLKNQYRGMTDLQRVQAINGIAARHNALSGLGGSPLDENRISLRVPTGGTADQFMALDYDKLNPEARLLYDTATKRFNQEFTGLMSSADSSAWKSEDDYERAVNNMQSVRDYGHLIEGHIFGAARRFLSPAMKVRFDANDRNFESFKRWYDEGGNQGASGNDSAESLWADNDSSWARTIKDRFWQDPNYEKYRERNGKLEQVPISPEQTRRAQLKAQREDQDLALSMRSEATKEMIGSLPPDVAGRFMVGPDGKPFELPQAWPSLEEQAKAIGDISGYQVKYTSAGKPIYAPKAVDRTAMKNAARAEVFLERGIPIAADGDGNPVLTGWQDNVELFDKKSGARVNAALAGEKAIRDQRVADGAWEYRLKGNLKAWAPEQDAAPQAPAQTVPSVPPNIQAALDHIKANPNDKEVRQKLIELGYLRQ